MNLSDRFFQTAKDHPERTALWVDGHGYTYGDLLAGVDHYGKDGKGVAWPTICLGSVASYTAMLACHSIGGTFAPLSPKTTVDINSLTSLSTRGLAYIMFTSGSTGEPKGVPVTHSNALTYVDHMVERLGVTPDDRFSQAHDLTFDFSVHDVWVPWNAGASVYVVPKDERFAPARFINEHELTVFSCVPSVATSMDRLGLLTEGALPSLRWVVFCGEALTVQQAEAMQRAAPNARILNMYGPTEATVGITAYLWDPETSPTECRNGIVPIGHPFPGQRTRIMDGELCLSGSQVFDGYWRDEEATRAAFYGPWYRTGDLVEQDEGGCLHFIGRKDRQVQIRGHRVELGEVEAVIRDVTGTSEVACVAWPESNGRADGIVAFVGSGPIEGAERLRHIEAMGDRLPEYMDPDRCVMLADLPKNRNGKIDRRALVEMLEHEGAA